MNSLKIEATDDSPFVDFNTVTNILTISGESRPENASKFYAPVINWLNESESYFIENYGKISRKSLTFIFKLEYFNSSSAKYIMDIMNILKKNIDKGINIELEWHYDERDEDMFDAGTEFSSTFQTNINMKMVKY